MRSFALVVALGIAAHLGLAAGVVGCSSAPSSPDARPTKVDGVGCAVAVMKVVATASACTPIAEATQAGDPRAIATGELGAVPPCVAAVGIASAEAEQACKGVPIAAPASDGGSRDAGNALARAPSATIRMPRRGRKMSSSCASRLGRKGGRATVRKYGKGHMARIARKGRRR